MSIKFVNLTPHAIKVRTAEGGDVIEYPPSGHIVRVPMSNKQVGAIGPHACVVQTKSRVIYGMPEPELGTVYIVSRMVLDTIKDSADPRPDVVAPDTERPERDHNGRIICVRGLIA